MTALDLCLLTAICMGASSCTGCHGWSPATSSDAEHDAQHRREQAEDLGRWLENPLADLRDVDGTCVTWLDLTSCTYTFKAVVSIRLRDSRLGRVHCADIDGLTGAAEELGFERVAARKFEHTDCFFRGGRISDGQFVLLLHDKARQRYGIRAVGSPP